MINNWYDPSPQSEFSNFTKIPISEDWFDVYKIATDLFVFHEPRHYEKTIANLVIGQEKAALIDWKAAV